MKFLTIILISVGLFFSNFGISFANCKINESADGAAGIQNFIKDCASNSAGIDVEKMGKGNNIEQKTFQKKVVEIVEGALQYAGLFAIAAMVVSGIMFTTAYDNDEKLNKAKKTAIFAALGLLITLIAFPFVNAVVTFIYNIGG